MQRIKLEE